MIAWTRTSDGIWTRDGWTIRRETLAGSGQTKPFERVNVKARSAWIVRDPERFLRTGAATLANAKANADVQIARRSQQS